MIYKIVIPGKPVPKDRPRINSSGKMYTPVKTKMYEELVASRAREVMPEPLTGNVRVDIKIYGKQIKSDIDNLAKSILDGLTKVAYNNDRQVTVLTVEILQSPFERAEIELSEIKEVKRDDKGFRHTAKR